MTYTPEPDMTRCDELLELAKRNLLDPQGSTAKAVECIEQAEDCLTRVFGWVRGCV